MPVSPAQPPAGYRPDKFVGLVPVGSAGAPTSFVGAYIYDASTGQPMDLFRVHPAYKAGNTYVPYFGQSAAAAFPAADLVYYFPFPIYYPLTFTSALFRVTTGGAGSSVKSGIWANSAVSSRPLGAPLIVDNTGADTSSTGADVTAALAGSLASGWYWLGVKATGTMPSFNAFIGTQWMNYAAGATGSNPFAGTHIRTASTYSDDMPTLAEGGTFTVVGGSTFPVFGLVAA